MKKIPLAWPSRPTRLFGLGLGCALASCIAIAAWASTDDAPVPHRLPPPAMMMMGGPSFLPLGPMLDHVLDDVQASPTQRAQVHQILDAADADVRADLAAGRADHAQMLQLFSQPAIDAAAVEAVRERIEQRRDAESRRLTQAMVDAAQVLSVEQRQQIAQRIAQGPRHVTGNRPRLPAAQQ
jgi:Spy/CpxP family protein refolding chaperone